MPSLAYSKGEDPRCVLLRRANPWIRHRAYLRTLLTRLELADRLASGGFALTAVELAQLVEQPLTNLLERQQPWRWRDWMVEPINGDRWRLRRAEQDRDRSRETRWPSRHRPGRCPPQVSIAAGWALCLPTMRPRCRTAQSCGPAGSRPAQPQASMARGLGVLEGISTELQRKDVRLEQVLFGCRFSNPVGLAAGFDKNGVAAGVWDRFGFGFAEVGTVTWHGQPGNPRPRLFRLAQGGPLDRMGFNNGGAEVLRRTLLRQALPAAVSARGAGDQFRQVQNHAPRSGRRRLCVVVGAAGTPGGLRRDQCQFSEYPRPEGCRTRLATTAPGGASAPFGRLPPAREDRPRSGG